MLKNNAAIFFISLAYAILLGHNIIPHHHHDSAQEIAEHHNSNHNHEEESNVLSHMLSHFIHSADGFTYPVNHNISNTFSKQQLSFVAVLPDNFTLDEFLIPSFRFKPTAEHLFCISPHSHPSGLRAPPATFI